ncbi:hypothetical protein GQ473_00010 [archaeon]|nr:hypothetical protein [archaeon]
MIINKKKLVLIILLLIAILMLYTIQTKEKTNVSIAKNIMSDLDNSFRVNKNNKFLWDEQKISEVKIREILNSYNQKYTKKMDNRIIYYDIKLNIWRCDGNWTKLDFRGNLDSYTCIGNSSTIISINDHNTSIDKYVVATLPWGINIQSKNRTLHGSITLQVQRVIESMNGTVILIY